MSSYIIMIQLLPLILEKWSGKADIKKVKKFGKEQKSIAQLKKRRSTLKAKEKRTKAESHELKQINFALQARQKNKFGKIG